MLLKQTGPARRLSSSNEAFLTDTFASSSLPSILATTPLFLLLFLLSFPFLPSHWSGVRGSSSPTRSPSLADPGCFPGPGAWRAPEITPRFGHVFPLCVFAAHCIKLHAQFQKYIYKLDIILVFTSFHIVMFLLPLSRCVKS